MTRLEAWSWSSEYGEAKTVDHDLDVQRVKRLIDNGRVLLDTETTGLGPERELRIAQIGWKKEVWLLDPVTHYDLLKRLMDSHCKIVAHNAPFDLLSLAIWRWGDDEDGYRWAVQKAIAGQVIDTMVTYQMVNSEPRTRSLSYVAAKNGVHNRYEDQFNDEAVSLGLSTDDKYAHIHLNNETYLRYSTHDIFQLWAAYKLNKKHHMDKTVQDEVRCSVLYEILTTRGMGFDFARGQRLYDDLAVKLAQIMADLEAVGISKVRSSAQVAKALTAAGATLTQTTATGQPKVDKGVLASIETPKKAAKIARNVEQARSWANDQGRIVTLTENLSSQSSKGRLHPNLWRIGARTGRSSCSSPNLQQLNKHTGDARVRGLLTADAGDVTGSVDFDGMELRVLADLSGDKRLCKRLRKGADIHGELAKAVNIDRQKAKIANFAMLYGASAESMAHQSGMTVTQADQLGEAWAASYPAAIEAMADWQAEGEDTGRILLPNGWHPELGRDQYGRPAAYRAVNYMVQGWAAFLFRRSAIQVARAGYWRYVRMVVHDEFVLSLPSHDAQKLLDKVRVAAQLETKNMVYTTGGELYGAHWGSPED